MKVQVPCRRCGKISYAVPSYAKRKKYCSFNCYWRSSTKSPIERFWEKVTKTGSCWVWNAARFKSSGYGMFAVDSRKKRRYLAHRFSWEIHFGKIPCQAIVMHQCDNPPCVNPKHLQLGTNSENIKDAYRKGRAVSFIKLHPERAAKGSSNGSAKLTEQKIKIIKSLAKSKSISLSFIAKKFNVGTSTIWRIKHNLGWRHVQ